MENCNEISFTLNAILTEGMEDVTSRIETDFAASGGDGMEILNPYEENPVYNANLFVPSTVRESREFQGHIHFQHG